MKYWFKRILSLLVVLVLLAGVSSPALASSGKTELTEAIEKNASYLLGAVEKPQFGSSGGEWLILGLARSGAAVPQSYFDRYCAAVEAYVKNCKGVLHTKKYTEYSRVIVALTAIGADPANVAGYDLLAPLGDYDTTAGQGLNGVVWALIALDSGSYDMPANESATTQATRQMYVENLLSRQLEDGGWNLSRTGRSDTDMTAMTLQALAKYQDQPEVKAAVEKGLERLSALQNEDGGFSSYGVANAESCVQALVALCELGIDIKDPRFVKNGTTVLDKLLSYQNTDGSFNYKSEDSGSNMRASEHALYGLAAALRAMEGRSPLYRMDDVKTVEPETKPSEPEAPDETGGAAPSLSVPIQKPAPVNQNKRNEIPRSVRFFRVCFDVELALPGFTGRTYRECMR